jgi:ATP-binding cassette subfamily B protein
VNGASAKVLTDPWGLMLRSIIPGRQRWDVRALEGRPDLASHLESCLAKVPRVKDVVANPVTGRVLVTYSDGPGRLYVGKLVRDCLNRAPARPRKGQPGGSASLYKVLQGSLPERKLLIGPLAFSALSFIIHLSEGFFLVSTVKTKAAGSDGAAKPAGILRTLSVGFLLNAADVWARYHRGRLWRRLGQSMQQRLRTRLITRIEEQDHAFFDRNATARLMALVTQDTARIGELVERGGELAVDKALTIVACGTLLVSASPLLALMAALPLLLLTLPTRYFGRKAVKAYARRGEVAANFNEMIENSISGISDVKSFTAEHLERQRLYECGQQWSDASQEAASVSALESGISRGIYSIGFSLTSAQGGKLLADGKITQQQYMRVVYMFPRLLDALGGIEEVTRLYHGARNAADRIAPVLESAPQIRSGPVRRPRSAIRGEIEFENVSFSYTPGVPVLEDVSFRLAPGETLGIVGKTGSGKSTLLRLLMRFYDVGSGRILLDGIDIRELNLRDLRSAVSLVSQDVYLFHDNVLYGRPRADEVAVVEALREAKAEDLLRTLPGGLRADVGERGRRLSGGEKQRVSIARALLKDAPVLALDEVTSHLDYETEAAVQKSVRSVAADRSLITIAHRLSTVRDADRILVLDKGRIREQGRHDELVNTGGVYAALWALQTGTSQII